MAGAGLVVAFDVFRFLFLAAAAQFGSADAHVFTVVGRGLCVLYCERERQLRSLSSGSRHTHPAAFCL